ncbi:helix-turn-helix transcriptional regulator [Streptomyces albipurpureus]|uniref:Helix-turn-helix transcriptional regulator n=1 Tax=Streptomyces albipurpureus TaxID=2897419 RepID=A0ABT0UNG5_9ACTN|nr:helix-turn-helix transcriptional regulator [Streptomyces sp. CWNU-1]MCM2390169.1 helix-turn-helix transcriptional regulator [Streptomyces sp. CWNU-1]
MSSASSSGSWAVPGLVRRYDLTALSGLARGHSLARISAVTRTPAGTIRHRLLRLRPRIGAVNNAHAIAIAYRNGWLNELPPEPRPPTTLTPRQRQILTLMADGLTNRQIGAQLGITAHTALAHLRHIYQALDSTPDPPTALASRCHTVALAYQHGHLT